MQPIHVLFVSTAEFIVLVGGSYLKGGGRVHVIIGTRGVGVWSQLECLVILLDGSSDLRSLRGFTGLGTLILDRNKITSHVVLPPLPQLEVLWVNHNRIANLAIFVEAVGNAFPHLKHLSMMDNEAAPSYFNGGSKEDYHDYRCVCVCVCVCECVCCVA